MTRRKSPAPVTPCPLMIPLPEPPGDGDTLTRAGLRSAAAGVPSDHADAALFLALAELGENESTLHARYEAWCAPPAARAKPKAELKQLFHAAMAEDERLRALVASLPARTADGALAKLRYVLDRQSELGGTAYSINLSAIRDAVRLGFG